MKYYKLFINYTDKSTSLLFTKVKDLPALYAIIGYFFCNTINEINKIDYKEVQDNRIVDNYFSLSTQGTLLHIVNKEHNQTNIYPIIYS